MGKAIGGAGGPSGRLSIKVDKMMRSRGKPETVFYGINSGTFIQRRLSPLHAERYGPHHARLWEENG
jgi:hypothetical protein